MPYWNTPLVAMSGSPFLIGSGMTPGAPDIGWPPPSNISETLTASRASSGQNEVWSIMIACAPFAIRHAPRSGECGEYCRFKRVGLIVTRVGQERQRFAVSVLGGPTSVIDVGGRRFVTDPTFDAPGQYGYHTKTVGPAVP